MKILLLIFSLSTIFGFVEWKSAEASPTNSSHVESVKKKKKRKKPKKKKTKKKKDKKSKKKNPKQDSAKLAKIKKKKEKKTDKALDKLAKKKEKKAKTVKKAQEDRKEYDKCDSTDLVRTSQDTAILVKYIKIYRTLGGVCYILHLQKMADLYQSSDGFYSVQMTNSKDPRAPAAWQTYLYCPIGKPNGTIALMSPLGDTIQMCTYLNEKKNGMMYYVKKGKGVIYKEKYVNDIKVWEAKPEED